MAYDSASPAAKKAKIPDGYESAEAFLKEARERYQEDVDFDRENREEALKDLEFLAGDQWEQEDIDARKGRPCLTINTLPQFVAQVVGDIRINRPGIKARPAEDADKDLASIREGLIRAIEHDSNAQQVYANAGTTQVGCGLGNFRLVLEYASDDVFERNIRFKGIPNPFSVVWDAARTEPTGKDAGHAFLGEDMPRKVFEKLYPDEVPSDLGAEMDAELNRSGWCSRDMVRVTEYWVMKDKPAEIAMLQDGSIKELTKENREALMPMVARNGAGSPMIRKTTRKRACMYLITGHAILEDAVEYPISRIPIFRVPGWELNTGTGKTTRWGLVRFARDPARLKNYWRSVMAEKLALAPRQQWVIHESQTGDQDEFRNAAQSGDTVLTWNGAVEPKRMDPPQIEAALMQEAALNSQDMKDVTGLHDASLGAKSNETSGRAILARQKEGDVASYIYHDNLKSAIAEGGMVANELIPVVYDTARTIRVLGEDEQQKIQRVNDPNDPDSIDLAKGKYDIVVETGPSYSTKRVEAAESMMAFVQAVPTAAQFAGDLIAKAQDWPLAEEIGDRMKKSLPPGVADEDPEKMTPEQQQAREAQAQQAQQMQEMQQHAAELELNDKAAGVELKHAQAVKTLAEAKNVGAVDQGPGETPLDLAIKEADLRIANANARKAEAEADKAEAEVPKAHAEAQRSVIGIASDHIAAESAALDLQNKPTEQELARKTTEKALKEPPKQAAKPAK